MIGRSTRENGKWALVVGEESVLESGVIAHFATVLLGSLYSDFVLAGFVWS